MSKFNRVFEEMMAGVDGVFGDLGGEDHGGAVGNSDWYATGDARVPKVIGAKRQKYKRKGKTVETIPVLRRNLNIPL